jgi:hypothetical protein
MSLETADKKQFFDRIECIDDSQLDRVESFIFDMEEQR